jgi:hypothetical protein
MTNIAVLSDAHKDAYGFRPSADTYRLWASLPAAELAVIEDRIYADVIDAIEREHDEQARAIAAFEAEVTRLSAKLGADRATVIRWLIQAEGCEESVQDYGLSYFAYTQGLPTTYFDGVAK